jgi:hypothetical protein
VDDDEGDCSLSEVLVGDVGAIAGLSPTRFRDHWPILALTDEQGNRLGGGSGDPVEQMR